MNETMKDSGVAWIGEVPESWQCGRIKDYYQLITGFTPDTTVSEYYDDENGYGWVSIADINDKLRVVNDTKSKISYKYIREKKPQITNKGSLLYSFKLSVGKVVFTDKDLYTNEAIASFINNKNVNLNYLYYSSMFIIENANINIYGAPIMNQELIRTAPIVFPSLNEQTLIANFLDEQCGKIDDIATNLEKQIDILQKYKKSLITETVTKGLDKSAPMKDSGIEWIGEIPTHWEVKPIKYMTKFLNGDRGDNYPSKSEMTTDGIPFINAGHLLNGGLDFDNMDYITNEKYKLMGGVKLIKDDILYCLRGSIGKNSIINISNGTVASSLVAIRSHTMIAKFLYYCINSNIENVQRFLWDNGTAQPNLSAENLSKFKICLPNKFEQVAIANFLDQKCTQIDSIIDSKKEQLSKLQQHKKSLIYEYVTGKKRVKGATENGN